MAAGRNSHARLDGPTFMHIWAALFGLTRLIFKEDMKLGQACWRKERYGYCYGSLSHASMIFKKRELCFLKECTEKLFQVEFNAEQNMLNI